MIGLIDNFLNQITMYKLVLYYLIFLLSAAVVLGFLGIISINPVYLIISTLFLVGVCWVTNMVFATVFKAHANVESTHITALILALIISPTAMFGGFTLLFWAGVLAIASKYIVAIGNKHLFNPVAFSVIATSFALGQSASWWVGTLPMLPFVLVGVLIVRKIRRFDLVFYFLLVAISTIGASVIFRGGDLFITLRNALLYSPLFFFAFVMLTEPQTMPPTKNLQSFYGALVGFLFAPQVHFLSFYTTPEIALVLGNIFSYMVSPKDKLLLKLKEKARLADDVWDFVFVGSKRLAFSPGQYLEWTLGHENVDSRGNRRYFTIASSPTENGILLGVKFYNPPSSFKKSISNFEVGSEIVASQLAGDFTMPADKNKKLVFIAGGIGVTPFRSMIKYMLDTNERRDVVLFYSNRNASDIVYKNILEEAYQKLRFRTVYTLTDTEVPLNWTGKVGYVDSKMIAEEVPDWRERTFYISGSHSMVAAFEKTLRGMGVAKKRIKTDFFPGFA
jgi:ferredoxin-NADP reductase